MINCLDYYQPPKIADWQGRPGVTAKDYFYQVIQLLDLTQGADALQPGFALLGFCSDVGVQRNLGRPGAAAGPQAIKQTLAAMAVHRPLVVYDVGNIVVEGEDLESAQTALGEVTQLLLQQQITPLILGGGHETAWGHYQGLAGFLQHKPVNIINFDAHFDLRDIPADKKGHSGTPFRQIAADCRAKNLPFHYSCLGIQPQSNTNYLFAVAEELGVNYLLAEDMYLKGPQYSANFLKPILQAAEPVYLSLCLDVLGTCYAPGVSAPQALGLSPWQILPLVRQILASNKLLSLDIVELAPAFDPDLRTRKLAAALLSDILHNVG